MRSIVTIAFITSAAVFGAGPSDFFPLQVGNQWIYRASGSTAGDPVVASIPQTSDFGGQTFFLYSGFDGSQWLRADANGVVYVYDTSSKTENVFIAADGSVKPFNTCNQTGHVVSTTADYTGPLGTWRGDVIEVQYDTGTCADAGLIQELYLPYVGLVQRTSQTIAGPRTYNLVYARIGGVMVATAPETSFTVALDSTVYPASPAQSFAQVRMSLRHTGSDTLKLDFGTGQEYDVVIRNSSGAQVYQWSTGRVFSQLFHTVTIEGERNWAVQIPLSQLAPGTYTLEAFLANTVPHSYAGTVAFTVTAP